MSLEYKLCDINNITKRYFFQGVPYSLITLRINSVSNKYIFFFFLHFPFKKFFFIFIVESRTYAVIVFKDITLICNREECSVLLDSKIFWAYTFLQKRKKGLQFNYMPTDGSDAKLLSTGLTTFGFYYKSSLGWITKVLKKHSYSSSEVV